MTPPDDDVARAAAADPDGLHAGDGDDRRVRRGQDDDADVDSTSGRGRDAACDRARAQAHSADSPSRAAIAAAAAAAASAAVAAAPGLPVAPSLLPTLQAAQVSHRDKPVDRRVVLVCLLAAGLGALAGLLAQALTALIALATNLAYFGRLSIQPASPAAHHLGWLALLPPVAGGLLVGLMARFGSKAIRGHGIPEAMEQVLLNGSRIPPRLTFLKPISAAIAIGTGGPFGAEGPIIATGGAFGSLIGQVVHTTAIERKTLLAAGAAAGMSATFGTPVAAVLLAVELLLFEFRARSLIPVALASAMAAGVRAAWLGSAPAFTMPPVAPPGAMALAAAIVLGALMGLAAVAATRAVYAIEDAFERLPLHWMWWPAIGGLAVGLVGLIEPATLGVGYDNIDRMLSGALTWRMLLALSVWKFVSWAIALGSGTSGGTLAPLFTVGGAIGALLAMLAAALLPDAGLDPRLAALVGMTALFAGASHALLAWVVFACEATQQTAGLLPLLAGAATAYLVSMLCMRYSIMTEKIARRGVPVARGYEVDHLRQTLVRDWATRQVVCVGADETLGDLRARLAAAEVGRTHQGFPVVDAEGRLTGVVSRRDIDAAAVSSAVTGVAAAGLAAAMSAATASSAAAPSATAPSATAAAESTSAESTSVDATSPDSHSAAAAPATATSATTAPAAAAQAGGVEPEAGAAPAVRRVRDLVRRPAIVTFEDATLRDAADEMVRHDVGRLPVVARAEPWRLVGIITRSDLLRAHSTRLDALHRRDAPLAAALGTRWTQAAGRTGRRRRARSDGGARQPADRR